MKFEILSGDRKEVVRKLEELTGRKPAFTRAPRFAYILDGIVVEKDSTVTTDPGADLSLARRLEEEGVIKALEPYPEAEGETESAADAEETGTTEEGETAEETEGQAVTTEETETAEETTEETETTTVETTATEAPNAAVEEAASDAVEETTEVPDQMEQATVIDAAETGPEIILETVVNEEEGDGTYEGLRERIDIGRYSIALPLNRHKPESICNLVFTIYAKGKLMSKATEGEFRASDNLVDTLKSENFLTVKEVLETILDYGEEALVGLRFEEDKVIFDGFPETDDADKVRAWTELCAAINKTAIKQHHIQAKQTEEVNEKFAFRTWLTRLGMNGPELKQERSLLYRNLSGHTAFRTPADEEKWKKRQAEKKQELRRAREAAQ